jgi:hypothetical protein
LRYELAKSCSFFDGNATTPYFIIKTSLLVDFVHTLIISNFLIKASFKH